MPQKELAVQDVEIEAPSEPTCGVRLPSPGGETEGLTPAQSRYLAAIMHAGGAASRDALATAAGVAASTPRVWRCRSKRFVAAEIATYRAALYEKIPDALKAVSRLLRADLDHGAAGLAATDRAVRLVLEGSGTIGEAAPTLRVEAALRVSPELVTSHVQERPTATVGVVLDADWSTDS